MDHLKYRLEMGKLSQLRWLVVEIRSVFWKAALWEWSLPNNEDILVLPSSSCGIANLLLACHKEIAAFQNVRNFGDDTASLA